MRSVTVHVRGVTYPYFAVRAPSGRWYGLLGGQHFEASSCSPAALRGTLPRTACDCVISLPEPLARTVIAVLRAAGTLEVATTTAAPQAAVRLCGGGVVVHDARVCTSCLRRWDADAGLSGPPGTAQVGEVFAVLAAAAVLQWTNAPPTHLDEGLLADQAGVRWVWIMRHPRCGRCAVAAPGRRALTDVISPYGPVSWVSPSTGEDEIGLPVYHAKLAQRALGANQYHGGKGFRDDEAIRSAIGECLERFEAFHWQFRGPIHSSMSARRLAPLLAPDRFGLPGCDEAGLLWTDARELYGDRRFSVPAGLVAFPYLGRDLPGGSSHTHGLAAGPTITVAAEHALLELLERDAYWMVLRHQLSMPDLPIDLCENPDYQELVYRLRTLGITPHFKLLDVGLQPPTVHCLLAAPQYPRFTHGAACRWDIAEAMRAAVLEAVQLRIDQKRLRACGTDAAEEPLIRWGEGCFVPEVTVFLTGDRAVNRSLLRRYSPTDLRASLSRQGLGPPLYVDVSSNTLPVKVVRVLVPGFDWLERDLRLGGRRLLTLPWRLGLTERPLERIEELPYRGTVFS